MPELTFRSLNNDIINETKNAMNDFSINSRLIKAKGEKPMKKIFGSFCNTDEIILVAGDAGVGKSTLMFQLADGLSKGESIINQTNEAEALTALYLDFELSNQALLKRYYDKSFSEKFLCPDMKQIFRENNWEFDVDILEQYVSMCKPQILFVDNITALVTKSTQDQETAMNLMKSMDVLRSKYQITIIVLTHIPKIPEGTILHKNHISGSKNLVNIADSAMILAKSNQHIERRYLKSVKTRNGAELDKVLVMDISNTDYLHFDYVGFEDERDHTGIDIDRETAKVSKYRDIAMKYFDGQELRYNEFCNKYSEQEGLSIEAAKKVHQNLKQNNLIIKENKKWILNQNEISV